MSLALLAEGNVKQAIDLLVKSATQLCKEQPAVAMAVTGAVVYLSSLGSLLFMLSRPEPKRVTALVDPVGSENSIKQLIAGTMAWISRQKELRKSSKSSPKSLEAFHTPENHAFFNESYYFNGCDLATKDRFITRISRRSYLGSRTYVFLLVDSKEHGLLQLEEDCPAESKNANPTAMGLEYVCEIPMKRWRIKYHGPMRKGMYHPKDYAGKAEAEYVTVKLDLVFEVDSPLFWYMRDDHPTCLANNLSQENWGRDFLGVCMKRTIDHAHYEDFGIAKGSILIGSSTKSPQYEFATFRDHSWDIRRWAAIDKLKILLIALEEPLVFHGHEYWYLDVTLVDMPGNVAGVARYSTGYMLGKVGTPRLVMKSGTSPLDIEYSTPSHKESYMEGVERAPLPEETTVVRLTLHPKEFSDVGEEVVLKVKMTGQIRRLLYWPDHGASKVYEDYQDMTVMDCKTGKTVVGYGTRQSGFRVGEFDASLGGCG
ncbi:hypothetical protein BASA81_005423 [Batrachochytrium salamandrivorans]|nr:hypothetical protein BASA81_005423 [Batrachochytrium salamandrivorans]